MDARAAASLQSVAQLEGQLQKETARIAERITSSEVYAWALRQAGNQMQNAAERLAGQRTDAQTVRIETEAWSRLGNLVQALKLQPSSKSPQENENPPQDEQQHNRQDGIPDAAQLVLLKMLQEDLFRRTSLLDKVPKEGTEPSGESTRQAAEQLDRLAIEQGELARLLERLANSANDSRRPSDGAKKPGPPRPPGARNAETARCGEGAVT